MSDREALKRLVDALDERSLSKTLYHNAERDTAIAEIQHRERDAEVAREKEDDAYTRYVKAGDALVEATLSARDALAGPSVVAVPHAEPPPDAALREFFWRCWDYARGFGGELDGGDVQEWGEKAGLLQKVHVTEPCDEGCVCDEYGDFPMDCYRPTVSRPERPNENPRKGQGDHLNAPKEGE